MLWIDIKYANQLNTFFQRYSVKRNNPYLANFRCPICGDSKKSKSKARAYLYPSNNNQYLVFKCHNCNASMGFRSFLKQQADSLFKEYEMETFKERGTRSTNVPKVLTPKAKSKEGNLLNKLLPTLSQLDKNNPGVKYAMSRKIPYEKYREIHYLDDMSKLGENRLKGLSALVFPFKNINGKLVGMTCRITDKNSSIRYHTVSIVRNTDMIYNLNEVDKTKTVYCTEGPIDSLFLPNAIAAGGSSMNRIGSYFPKDKLVLVYDNQPRNEEIVKIMRRMANDDYAMVVWPENIQSKDINDMIKKGRTSNDIMKIIKANTHRGLDLIAQINHWKKTTTV
jgi:transcription elongation factor Elf1